MKKSLSIFIIVLMFLATPLKVLAATQAEISAANVIGPNKKLEVGEEFAVEYSAHFSNLFKDGLKGIAEILLEIEYDSEVLIPSTITSPNFTSSIFLDKDNKYYIYSVVSENIKNNACVEGMLYCGDYKATVNFYIKKYKETPTTLKIKNVTASILNLEDVDLEDIDQDSPEKYIQIIQKEVNETFTLDIKPSDEFYNEGIKDILKKGEVPKVTEIPKLDNIKKPTEVKSVDNDLKNLEIVGYELDFDKSRHQYTIEIDSDVNNLEIKAETNSSKAKYKITGADNLKENDYKVEIEVTSEDNKTSKYTIIANVKKSDEKENTENKIDEDQEMLKQINAKMLLYGGIALGVIFLIIILAIIGKIRKDRYFKKYLK